VAAPNSHLCMAGVYPRHKRARVPSTTCAESLAQSPPYGVDVRACCRASLITHHFSPITDFLIATDDPTRIGIPSDQREPRELSSSSMRMQKPTVRTEAKKRLIATLPNSKIMLSPWEPTLNHFLTATKTAFPSLQRPQFLDGLGRDPSGEIPFLPQGRQTLPGTQGNPSRQTLFVSQRKGNYLAGFAIVSLGASGVPEVYNPGRVLRRHP
jgi:hypothetical protein